MKNQFFAMSSVDQATEQLLAAQSLSATVANVGLQGNGGYDNSATVTQTTDTKDDKKSDEPPKIKRPMNPFMIFGCEKRRKLAQVHPRMHNSEISKILGAEWKRMSEYEKAPYVQEAKRLKEQHSIEYPNYKFKANRRKPRQAVKKERPTFPYATDLNTLPTAMKFPYPTAFFQDSMYGSIYPAMAGSSHPAYSMYGDYSSALARQAMTGGGSTLRGAQPSTTTASGDYYTPLKGSVAPVNDYYGGVNKSSEYYSAMHAATGARTPTDRSTPTGTTDASLTDRYSSDNRQFESRYSSFNGTPAAGSSVATYTTMQNMSHLSNDSPTAYTYASLYDQRH